MNEAGQRANDQHDAGLLEDRLAAVEAALLKQEAAIRGRSRWSALRDGILPLISVLVGGCIAFFSTWSVTQLQLDASARETSRATRAEVYAAYLDAANVYAVAAQQRFDSCEPGSDVARSPSTPCSPMQLVYQNARYEYSRAWHELELVGTDRAIAVAGWVSALLPDVNVGFTGDPVDATAPLGLPQSGLMSAFRDVQRCDVAAQVPDDCEALMADVDELLESLEDAR